MKTISVKFDDYVLDLLNKEAEERKTTRMELIRSAIIDFLLNRDDAEDLAYVQRHSRDRLLSFGEIFSE